MVTAILNTFVILLYMKKYSIVWLILLAFKQGYSQGYQITLQAPQYKAGIAYLTYYMGNNFNIEDSAIVNQQGVAVFKDEKKLPGGIYVVFLPGKRVRIDFLMGEEQKMHIKTDTTDIINKTIITGSKENILYQQYQKYIQVKASEREFEKKAYAGAITKSDSLLHEKKFNALTQEMEEYRDGIIKNHPQSMLAALLAAMKPSPSLTTKPKNKQDSIAHYNYYKSHYWDGISFMDERVIRTPFFLPKLERYYREVIMVPDTIIQDVDYKLLLARSAPEMYKFLLNWLTDEFIYPKYMGQDAVFVHLFEKYHSQGLSNWLNEKQMETITRRAYMLMANLVGEKAANLEMTDTTGKKLSLYNVKAEYIVVSFWDPHCGHCKTEIPKLDSMYKASWKQHDVIVYAVLSPDKKEGVKEDWVKFIQAHQLTDWIHVYQTEEMEAAERQAGKASYRQLYDVTTTPTLYLLDKEKRIIGKKLTWQQLNELLEVKWNSPN